MPFMATKQSPYKSIKLNEITTGCPALRPSGQAKLVQNRSIRFYATFRFAHLAMTGMF